jgi:hypothetical protein
MKKYIYHFDELNEIEARLGNDWENIRGLLGG